MRCIVLRRRNSFCWSHSDGCVWLKPCIIRTYVRISYTHAFVLYVISKHAYVRTYVFHTKYAHAFVLYVTAKHEQKHFPIVVQDTACCIIIRDSSKNLASIRKLWKMQALHTSICFNHTAINRHSDTQIGKEVPETLRAA